MKQNAVLSKHFPRLFHTTSTDQTFADDLRCESANTSNDDGCILRDTYEYARFEAQSGTRFKFRFIAIYCFLGESDSIPVA